MKRKLISYICLIAIFMESVPVNALSNLTSEVIPLESLEQSTEQEEGNIEVKEDDSQGTETTPKLEDNVFNIYILDKEETNDYIKAYLITSGGNFGFEGDDFTIISGYSLVPMVIEFSKDENNNLKLIKKE